MESHRLSSILALMMETNHIKPEKETVSLQPSVSVSVLS